MVRFELLDGVSEVPRDAWNALVGEESPFLEWDWLASLEQAGAVGEDTGWSPRPLVAREGGHWLAACPLYAKGHSEGEFVFDWGWADAAARAGIRYYPKLLVGIPFTPVTGARFLVRPDQDRAAWIERFAHALRELCVGNELSSVHVNFCRPDEIAPLEKAGFELRIGVQYHWLNEGYADFDAWLARFRSKRRNQIRREIRELEKQGIRIEVLVGDAILDELFDPMFEFYLSTIRTHYYGREYLNQAFFRLLRERFRDRLCFVVARNGAGRPIAGALNVQKGKVLYGRYWGCSEELRYLHFNVCYYAAARHCIEHGLDRFEPGAGGDYKQLRGFDARPTWSLHFVSDERLRAAISRFLESERGDAEATLEWMHDHSALKRPG